ncbi:MAG: hypothetical protein EBX76_03155 [Acidimicrobiia bacterium]|nr:hypothetical protein [Acidimicrobiia bacterium]
MSLKVENHTASDTCWRRTSAARSHSAPASSISVAGAPVVSGSIVVLIMVSVVLFVIVLVLSCRRPQFSPHGVENVSDVTCR